MRPRKTLFVYTLGWREDRRTREVRALEAFGIQFPRRATGFLYLLATLVSESALTFLNVEGRGQSHGPWMQLVVQRRGRRSMADMTLGCWDHVPA